jgi:uncharacterized protein YggL (DUF469 family)
LAKKLRLQEFRTWIFELGLTHQPSQSSDS